MLAVFVDGVLITRFGGKPGATAPRPLGHGMMLSPQVGMPCSFSNLWFGPWNGRLPGEPVGTEATPNTAMLNNGDEAQGTVELATPSTLKLASDVGPLDLPLDRITMIDFGGAPPARTAGSRLRLADAGVLTVGMAIGSKRTRWPATAKSSEICSCLWEPSRNWPFSADCAGRSLDGPKQDRPVCLTDVCLLECLCLRVASQSRPRLPSPPKSSPEKNSAPRNRMVTKG